MADKQKCSIPGCQNSSSQYRCSATTHFTFRPTTDSDIEEESESDSESDYENLIDVPASALGSSAEYIAFVRSIKPIDG